MREGRLDAVIVGAGFSGMAAALELKSLGLNKIAVIEREDDLGGTWHVNRYPGVAVDVVSTSYQYWFEKNPDWSRIYAPGPELKAYAEHVATKYDVRRHIRFRLSVIGARWDDDAACWHVTCSDGAVLTARFLISATGFLSQPHVPDIPGLSTFQGTVLHTTDWDATARLKDRNVGIIGTGATAVQLIPELAKQARTLTVYQRTPIWVLPKVDFQVPAALHRLYAHVPGVLPIATRISDAFYQAVLKTVLLRHHRFGRLVKIGELQCKALLFVSVRDRRIRAELTPSYDLGCKRPSVSNVYYRTFDQPHVRLETSGIDRIEAHGIVARNGSKAEVDTLVLATGFNIWQNCFPAYPTTGRDGADLGQWWRTQRYESYQGITVPQFPNYFAMTCPWAFTGVSFFDTIRTQLAHMDRLLSELIRRGASTFEVTSEASARFTATMRNKMATSLIQRAQCATSNTYYLNDYGDAAWFRPVPTRAAIDEQALFPLSDYTIA